MAIRDEIDRSFGSGPDTRSVDEELEELLRTGHRDLRRRRLAAVAAAAVVAVVVGGTALATAGGGSSQGAPVAGEPSSTATTGTMTPSPASEADPAPPTRKEIEKVMRRTSIAEYDGSGHLKIDPRAEVVDRIDNPFGLVPPRRSVGLAVEFRGAEYWFALYEDADGGGGGATVYSGDAKEPFRAWVASQSGIAEGSTTSVGPDVWPGVADLDLVSFIGNTEELRAAHGVTILEQRAHVSVGDSFAGPGDHTAAALVEAANGQRYHVLARSFDGKPGQYIAVKASDRVPTLDAFLDLARDRYAEGGGGLL